MEYITTLSTAFNAQPDCLTEISFNSDTSLKPGDTDWLLDPTSPRDALQRLRVLKTRNTGSVPQRFSLVGRERGNNINFSGDGFNYTARKMRRKAGVLQYKQKSFDTIKQKYASLVRGINPNKTSTTRLKQLAQTISQCDNNRALINKKPAINSGIKNDNTELYLNKNIPFVDSL